MARNFPEEVITEILSWLPVKSLMRFKCLSKPWLHLISNDPRFMKLHFSRSFLHTNHSNPGILVSRKEGVEKTEFYYAEEYTACSELTRFEIPFSHPVHECLMCGDYCCDFRVVNVCNGLLCLTDFYKDHSNAYIWNPITGDHIAIPGPPIPNHFREQCYLWEEGDKFEYGGLLRETDVMFGFGFNQASDEYKVIRFVSISAFDTLYDHHSHVAVYTLGTDSSWRTLQQFVPYNISLSNHSTALVNGCLHWFGSKLNESVGSYTHDTLIAFSLQDEIFQEIPHPDGFTYGCPFEVNVGELGGLLSIFCSLQHEHVEIWVMEEYGVVDSWRKLWKIVQPDDSCYYLEPLGVAESGEIIIKRNTWELISYDPNINLIRDLHRFEFQAVDAYTFKASLLSPTIINGASRKIH